MTVKMTGQTSGNTPDGQSAAEQRLFEQLERYMDEQQPYTDPSLNRKKLAEALNTNESYVRYCIMNNAGVTVNDYIMQYRLNHANQLLCQAVHGNTIESVAIKSGFGSRSCFYASYHKACGQTPKELRNAAKKQKNKSKNRILPTDIQ